MSTFSAYLIEPANGPREYETVKAVAERRARELGGTCTPIDVPATKAGLIPFLNAIERRGTVPPGLVVVGQPGFDQVDQVDQALDVRQLEHQVEALGEAGLRGLDELAAWHDRTGVGASFSRGVHLLSILAAGEHQLARLFQRAKGDR